MIIDNTAVEQENERLLRASPEAMANIDLCFKAVDVLRAAAELSSHNSADEIAVLRLGIRLINDAGACGACALGGYYQQAAAHIRDIIEVEFLLDLFTREPKEINRWRVCGDKARRRYFSADAVRKRLDKLDGSTHKARDAAYSLFTQHGTHADPDRIDMISPNRLTMVGPFPDRDRVVALSFELSRYLSFATMHIGRWGAPDKEPDAAKREAFERAFAVLNQAMFEHFAPNELLSTAASAPEDALASELDAPETTDNAHVTRHEVK